MRLGIDVRYLSHGLVGGIHTYLVNLIPALIEVAKDHEVILYADTKKEFEIRNLPDNIKIRYLSYKTPLSSIKNDLFMNHEMERDNLDVAHFTASYGFGPKTVRTVVTLQDEINIMPLIDIYRGHKKTLRNLAMMSYLHFCTKDSLKKADVVITVSEYSKKQILKFSTLKPEQVVVIPHACPTDIKRIQDEDILQETKDRLMISRPFILAEAFKNPAVLIRAWKLLPQAIRDSHEIIFFSRSPQVMPVVSESVQNGIARLFIRPSRTDLSALYSMARIFVFPSWIEGFGIPLIEAMTCGAPIIASNRGSIPEVVQNAGIIIDAEDEKSLAENILHILTEPAERDRLVTLGYERVSCFAWPKIAQHTLEAYMLASKITLNSLN